MKKPNIIFIMTDDQGYGDLSCMGSKDFVTPNIDELANNGALFTTMYSNSPVCSPSRASLLTGRYPGNAGVRSILAGHRHASGLTNQTPTIATALKKEGYNTGLIGKWHLGLKEGSRPNQNGFDYFYGFMAGCIDYYSHVFYWGMADGKTNPSHDLWENEQEVYRDGEYFTDMVTDKSCEFIRDNSKEDEPFFLYVGYNAPHYPMHAPNKYKDRFSNLSSERQIMAAMISAVDDGVGNIVSELKRNNIYENTIIYYQSDNGPSRESRNFMDGREDLYYGGSSGGFKGEKFSLFEGGIRVPGIISYPNLIPKGQIIAEPVASMDLFPTVLQAAGGNINDYNIDGKDLINVLTSQDNSPHDYIFWEMADQTAVRYGDYKLVINGYLEEYRKAPEPLFLSNIKDDPFETNNLVDTMPELCNELVEKATQWRKELENNYDLLLRG